jgi:crotonobetainyl-CoA:carnitine CoA-transferase CaiB-like acyl-CoA transferase
MTMAGALEGVRVVDFGQYIAGPLAAMLLADQGADVVRVDPPGGPRWATAANATWNRGKRSIVLNLHTEADRAIATRLIAAADVLVENFRPGVMERLGIGAEESLRANPRLLYCSLPGFAADDPRAALPGWEGIIAAATGTYRLGEGDAPPVFTALPIASSFAALLGAISIMAGLFSRARDGHGQRIEVPLYDATFEAIGANGLLVNGKPRGDRPDDYGGGFFVCADGRWIQLQLAKPRFIRRFVRAAGLDVRFSVDRVAVDRELRARIFAALPAVIRTRSADDWEQLGAEADFPLIKVRSAAEWIETPHARASEAVVPLDDPVLGSTWQPNSPVRLSRSRRLLEPAHRLDADRDGIIGELARLEAARPPPGNDRPRRRAALEGVCVLDLSQVLAGPTCGRTLAEFGAEVVKVNPPDEEGAGIRFNVHRYHTDVNRGKQTILLDLKRPGASEIFRRLAARSDIIVHNFRGGVLERLGCDYETTRLAHPGMIYVNVTAYGEVGSWGRRPGYERFGQAPTGISARQGGDKKPDGQPFAVTDYGSGLSAAFGALLALFERERSGLGQRSEAALAYTGTLLQSPYLIGHAGKRWDEPAGPDARGFGPLQRLYRARDEWLFLGASSGQLGALAAVEGLEGVDRLDGALLAAELEKRIALLPAAVWTQRLTAGGMGAHQLRRTADLMTDARVAARGLSVTRLHDSGEEVTTIGAIPRLSGTPPEAGRPAATPGADSRAVLEAVGLGLRFEALRDAGVVAEQVLPLE